MIIINRFMFNVVRIFPHLTLAFAAASLVLVILNYFNPLLGFLSSAYSQIVLIVLCITGMLTAVGTIALYRDIMGSGNKRRKDGR